MESISVKQHWAIRKVAGSHTSWCSLLSPLFSSCCLQNAQLISPRWKRQICSVQSCSSADVVCEVFFLDFSTSIMSRVCNYTVSAQSCVQPHSLLYEKKKKSNNLHTKGLYCESQGFLLWKGRYCGVRQVDSHYQAKTRRRRVRNATLNSAPQGIKG